MSWTASKFPLLVLLATGSEAVRRVVKNEDVGSCASYGCGLPASRDLRCQCNSLCQRFHDCCPDYSSVCKKSQPNVTSKSSTCPRVVIPKGRPDASFVFQQAACIGKLPFKNHTLVPKMPKNADFKRIENVLVIYVYRSHRDGKAGFYKLRKSNHTLEVCYSLFPTRQPMIWPNASESAPVCILAATGDGVEPVYWSDYNVRRGMPNFVAYIHSGKPKQDGIKRKWRSLPGFNDTPYYPGHRGQRVIPTADSHCGSAPDCACGEVISSRGHLATLSHLSFDAAMGAATNTYVNTVPARQPFDGSMWNSREKRTARYARDHGKIFIVKGPSRESDGKISAGNEVPSMLWGAFYSPSTEEVSAWSCRNGNQQPKDFESNQGLPDPVGCFCADGLTRQNIEGVVGMKLFPGVSSVKVQPLELPNSASGILGGGWVLVMIGLMLDTRTKE